MEKSQTLGENMICACSLLLKEANFLVHLIYFDHNFDHPHINVVTFVHIRQSEKLQFFYKSIVFCSKSLDPYLLIGLSSLFSQNSCIFLKIFPLIVVPLKN